MVFSVQSATEAIMILHLEITIIAKEATVARQVKRQGNASTVF
jgi:hypothetical protein